tara:strand:- start:108327 stop:109259 length:933 start_codon:yes stop_codon:yes gene_type:complete
MDRRMPQIPVGNSFIDEARENSYYDLVMPLYKMTSSGEPTYQLGTCFPIGSGVYLTAAHVFEGFVDARRRYQRPTGEKTLPTQEEMVERLKFMKEDHFLENTDVNCGILILDQSEIRNGRLKTLGFSLVTSIIMTLDFDMAVLFVKDDKRLNSDGNISPIALWPLIETPGLDQKVLIAGFPEAHQKLIVRGKGKSQKLEIGLSLVINKGEITEMHPEMHNLGNAFFPCLRTNAEIESGHSGGPAICVKTGGIIGINSTGGISGGIISWVGKAFDAELITPIGLKIGSESVDAGESTTLRKMAEAGTINIY